MRAVFDWMLAEQKKQEKMHFKISQIFTYGKYFLKYPKPLYEVFFLE